MNLNNMMFSRKKMRQSILPSINDSIEGINGGKGVIMYVHDSQMRFTAIGTATIDERIEIDNRIFKVDRVTDGKFNASFIGIKENPPAVIPDAPVDENEGIAKILDEYETTEVQE